MDSLINQDIPTRNYEIFITDDGSTDQTGTICDTYAAKYPFIHTTHTDNHGQAHARNVSLAQCRGKYVTCCDSDDLVSPQLISVLTQAINIFDAPDILVWNYTKHLPVEGFPKYDIQNMSRRDVDFCGAEDMCIKIINVSDKVGGYPWNKCIKRSVIGSILMNEKLFICEDMYWLLEVLSNNKDARCCVMKYCLYCYMNYPDLLNTRKASKKYTSDGMGKHIPAFEACFDIPNLSRRTAENLRGRLYWNSLGTLIKCVVKPSREVYARLRGNIRMYAGDFYFKSSNTILRKAAAIIIHILVLLHIHK